MTTCGLRSLFSGSSSISQALRTPLVILENWHPATRRATWMNRIEHPRVLKDQERQEIHHAGVATPCRSGNREEPATRTRQSIEDLFDVRVDTTLGEGLTTLLDELLVYVPKQANSRKLHEITRPPTSSQQPNFVNERRDMSCLMSDRNKVLLRKRFPPISHRVLLEEVLLLK